MVFLLTSEYVMLVFFFFQAEDGIRDLIVTGVQTCALPICAGRAGRAPARDDPPRAAQGDSQGARRGRRGRRRRRAAQASGGAGAARGRQEEIGRASCRERV